eukprot:117898-Rhodomonas_salina.1
MARRSFARISADAAEICADAARADAVEIGAAIADTYGNCAGIIAGIRAENTQICSEVDGIIAGIAGFRAAICAALSETFVPIFADSAAIFGGNTPI